jgi:hypothetical protein
VKTLLKGIRYVNKCPKANNYINEIWPLEDMQVDDFMFSCFEETNQTRTISYLTAGEIKQKYGLDVKRDILRSTGAPT